MVIISDSNGDHVMNIALDSNNKFHSRMKACETYLKVISNEVFDIDEKYKGKIIDIDTTHNDYDASEFEQLKDDVNEISFRYKGTLIPGRHAVNMECIIDVYKTCTLSGNKILVTTLWYVPITIIKIRN